MPIDPESGLCRVVSSLAATFLPSFFSTHATGILYPHIPSLPAAKPRRRPKTSYVCVVFYFRQKFVLAHQPRFPGLCLHSPQSGLPCSPQYDFSVVSGLTAWLCTLKQKSRHMHSVRTALYYPLVNVSASHRSPYFHSHAASRLRWRCSRTS